MANVHQEETQLIADYLEGGDDRLFEILVRRHRDGVFRVALSVLGPYRVADAEDVAQEVFIRAHRKLKAFRGESRLNTWLYRMAYNLAIDHTRRVRFRRPHLSDDVLDVKPLPPDVADPQQAAVSNQRSRQVHIAMAGLPSLYRSVLYLHYWLDCSVGETAEHLGIPAGSVKSYLQRGRAQLHKVLTRRGWTDG
jgi:RNA polymerase sigma-70 factor (ECF subfamily)